MAAVSARAQVSTNPNNTIVRFDIFTQATNFGSIDIELFDQDKPESVKNFLLYFYTGAYTNLLIHRVTTNLVGTNSLGILQAGQIRLDKPNSTNAFTEYLQNRSFGYITNEFNVGPVLSNTFGTIAAARVTGLTNSANTDWFINLADNPSLDAFEGGYTVFGRVISTTAPNNGTNLLKFFSTITNLGSAFGISDQLPFSAKHYIYSTNTNSVVTTNLGPIVYRDLFTIQASIVRGGTPRDRVRPKFTVSTPSTKVRSTTESNLTFSGTATDNQEVARVIYDAGDGTFIADGAANWSQELTLKPGTNIVGFKSIDWFGNESKPVRRTIFYKVPTEFTLSNSGAGIVVGATNKQMLDIGRFYTLTAKAARGNFFVGWNDAVVSTSPRIIFSMEEGTTISATFATNPFPRLRGSYVGMITPRSTNSGPHVAGMITLNLGTRGLYSGRLQLLGASYPFRGFFNLANTSAIGGKRGSSPLTLNLVISTNGPAEIHGDFVDGSEVGSVQLYRFERPEEAVPQAGQFTFAMAPQTNSALGEGIGIGTTTVSNTGAIVVNGTPQDAIDFTQATAVYSGGHFPLFVKRSSKEALLGWMTFSTNHDAFEGDVRWISPIFTNLFGESLHVNGSRFLAPQGGAPLLSWTNGSVMLSGEDLEAPVEVPVSLENGGIDVDTNTVNLQLTPGPDGRISGSFVHPGSQAVMPIQAVFLQNSNLAAGFFIGTNRSGAMRMRATE